MSDEADILAAHRAGDHERAVTLALSRYENEVMSFLVGSLGRESDAQEVFSQLCEDLWTSIARFEGRCSFRTWMYTLARNAANRFRRSPANQPARRVPLSNIPEPIARHRTTTRPFRQTEVKDRFAELREQLQPDEQTLLTLRVDRGLAWDEIARIMHDAADADDAQVKRLATNLRQRFRSVKKRIEALARAAGLLEPRA